MIFERLMTVRRADRSFGTIVCRLCAAFFGIGLAATLIPLSANASAAEADEGAGALRAVVIGVPEYDDPAIAPLPFIKNDTEETTATLHDLGGYSIRGAFLSDNPRLRFPKPTKENIQNVLRRVCASCRENDTLLVYFSCHGLAIGDESFALPQDAVRGNVESYLSIAEVRGTIHASRARQKFLFIDACFAGNTGKDAAVDSRADEIDRRFLSNLEANAVSKSPRSVGVFTLASSTSDQESWNYIAKNMSLFTYWLNEGLSGHADLNADDEVKTLELFEYVNNNVRQIKENQTPVMCQGGDIHDVQTVIVPKPVTRDRLLENITGRIQTVMDLRKIKSAGVMRFAFNNNFGAAKGLSVDFSRLLSQRLRLQRRDAFLDYGEFQKTLEQQKITPANWSKQISESAKSVAAFPDLIVTGDVSIRENRVCQIECRLLDSKTGETVHSIRGKTTLSELEAFAGEGFSGDFSLPDDEYQMEIVDTVSNTGAPGDVAGYPEEKLAAFDGLAERQHPFLSGEPRFDAWVEVKAASGEYQPREFYVVPDEPNNVYVPLEAGEVFRLAVRNRYDADAGMVALIDGRGTLPERDAVMTPDVGGAAARSAEKSAEAAEQVEGNEQVASNEQIDAAAVPPIVRPNHSRHWVIRKGTTVYLPGFFSIINEDGRLSDYNEFLVSDAPDPTRAEESFTARLGTLSLAFFGLSDPGRGPDDPLHIVPGEPGQTLVNRYSGPPVDFNRFLSGVTIRYERLETLSKRGAQIKTGLLAEMMKRSGLFIGE